MPDVIVIGGGPAGSTAANLLARKGLGVTLLERERFPRFQVGESLLPYNNDVFRRLGIWNDLEAQPFTRKYGGTFVTATGEHSTFFRFDKTLDDGYQQAFQVKRADFDKLLLDKARDAGVEVREETRVTNVDLSDDKRGVVTTAAGETLEARFIVDATGHGTLLGRQRAVDSLKKIAYFAHYRGVARDDGRNGGNTIIVILRNAWFWLIPVSDELMSIGLVVDRDHAMSCGLSPEELLARTIASTPYVQERMQHAERTTQVYTRRDFSYRVDRLTGPNFALVGDAAGFLDPIFSTGVLLAMTSAAIAADAIGDRLARGRMKALRRYEKLMQSAIDKYFRFITSFYEPEFLEVFLHPQPRFGLMRAVVGVLGGNVFAASRGDAMRMALFFGLVRIQKWRRGVIAPPIAWDALPAAASV